MGAPQITDKRYYKQQSVKTYNLLATFFFEAKGAKKKVNKKETPRIISRVAAREEGYAPSTPRAFKKARPKLFRHLGGDKRFVSKLKRTHRMWVRRFLCFPSEFLGGNGVFLFEKTAEIQGVGEADRKGDRGDRIARGEQKLRTVGKSKV